jgi:hypothetical protein
VKEQADLTLMTVEELENFKTELWGVEQDIRARMRQIEQEMRRRADKAVADDLIASLNATIEAPSAQAQAGE